MHSSKLNERALLAASCLLALLACSSDPASPAAGAGAGGASAGANGTAGATASGGASPGNPNELVGGFIIELKQASATVPEHTEFVGNVSDGVSLSNIVWDVVTRTGGCELLKPRAPFCSAPCENGDTCVEDDQCATSPTLQSAGIVTLKGLGSADIEIEPIVNRYQLPGDVRLPFPPAAEGAAVTLTASGGTTGAFTIDTRMVAPLVSSGTVTIDTGKSLTLTWQAPADKTQARMQVKLDISKHGGSKGKIECDVVDSGELEIPAALITKLIDLGVAGFSVVNMSRVGTGSTVIAAGKVNFQTLSELTRELVVAGVESCYTTAECTSGTCNLNTKTCQP